MRGVNLHGVATCCAFIVIDGFIQIHWLIEMHFLLMNFVHVRAQRANKAFGYDRAGVNLHGVATCGAIIVIDGFIQVDGFIEIDRRQSARAGPLNRGLSLTHSLTHSHTHALTGSTPFTHLIHCRLNMK